MKYTIKEVNKDGNLVVYVAQDESTHVFSGDLPDLTDVDAVKEYVSEKVRAYAQGLEVEKAEDTKPEVSKEVEALFNKPQDVSEN